MKPKYRIHYFKNKGWVVQTRWFYFWYKWNDNVHDGFLSAQEAKDQLESIQQPNKSENYFRMMR